MLHERKKIVHMEELRIKFNQIETNISSILGMDSTSENHVSAVGVENVSK